MFVYSKTEVITKQSFSFFNLLSNAFQIFFNYVNVIKKKKNILKILFAQVNVMLMKYKNQGKILG